MLLISQQSLRIAHSKEILLQENGGNFGASIYVTDQISALMIIDCKFYGTFASRRQNYYIDNINNPEIYNNRRMYQNAAYYAGAILIQQSVINISNCTFRNNFAMFGGVLIGSSVALVTVKDTQFLNNFGNQFGVIRLSTQITYSFENCKFINNGATGAASTMILIETYPGIIKDCEFRGNYNLDKQSGLGLINLISASQAQIINSKFIDNYANYTHPGIYMTLSSVVIIDCLFENTKSLQLYNKYFSYNGNFIQVLSDSRIDINNTIFRNGRAMQGGAIYQVGSSMLYINNCTFINNSATGSGGVIYSVAFRSLYISNNSYFFNNKAGKSGDCIYSDNTQEEILINETFFLSEYNSNFLYLNQIGKFQMNDTILRGNQSVRSLNNSGIYIKNAKQMLIRNITISNITNQKVGGCLYMNQDLLEKDFTPKAIEGNEQLIILNSTFKFCQAQKGGAAYFEDVQGLLIGNNSNFFYNRAFKEDSAFGGAIDFYCQFGEASYQKTSEGKQIYLCSLQIDKTTFFNNTSAYVGGSISWNYLEPIMGPRITLTRNYANIYGDNISSVAKYMTKLSTEQYNQLKIIQNDDQRRRFLQAISSELMSATNTNKDSSQIIQNQQSGGNVPNLYFALIDKYGQIVYSDQNSKLYVQVNTEVKKNENQQFSAAFEATTQYNIIDGIFNVDNLVLTATPNTTDGIDYNLPDNQQIYSDAVELQQYNVTVQLRTCLEGEELLSSGKCRSCQGPDYYLLKKTSKITNCLECQKSKSYCDGGNQVFPKANYWRSSMDSDNFISCRNPIACLGRNGKENNYLGSCRQGYQGILCIDCQLGFSRTGTTYLCSNCPDPTANAFRLIGLLTVMIMLMCFMVRSTLQGALAKKNFISVYVRILMNHFQLLTLTASFDLQWPEQLSEFFNFAKPVSESSTQFVSIDCFVDLRENNQDKGKVRVILWKTLFFSITPIIIILASILVWRIIYLLKPIRQNSKSKVKQQSINKQDQHQNFEGTEVNNFSTQRSKIDTFTLDSNQQVKTLKHADSFLSLNSDQLLSSNQQTHSQQQETYVMQQSTEQTTQNQNNEVIMMKDEEIVDIQKIAKTDKKLRKKTLSEIKRKSTSTIIIILFMVHPSITTAMFNIFNCQNIDGTNRLYDDLEVICGDHYHYIFATFVALPCILIWSLGIPMFGFFRLYRGRLNLDKFKTKQTLGFLYNGYRNHSYYWEIIIMYRKITIIFISVFMAQSGKIVQAMMILLFLTLCIAINAFKQPFANFRLNTLEQISLASSVLTVYCGIFYIADVTLTSESQFNLGEDAKLALFALIVISNAIFFGYWVTQFLQEIKTTLRSKNPLIYKYLYLCGNNRILEKEIKIQNLVEKQQDFINDIEKINDYLIEQKKVYQSGRIPQEDKDFKKAMIALQQFQKETMNKRKFNKQETTNLDNYSQVVAVRSTLRNTVKSFQQQLTEDKLIDIQELELYQNNKEQQIMLEDSMYQSSIGNTQGEDEYYQIEQEISQIYNKPVHTFENSQADLNDWSQTNAGFQLPFSQEEQKNLNQIYRNKTNKDIKERQTNFEKAHLHFQLPLEQSQQKDQNSSRFQQKLMQQHPLTFRVNLARLNEASRQYQSQEIDMVDDDLTLTSRRNLENPYRNQGQNNDSFGLPYDSKLQRNEEDDFSSGLDLLVSNLQTKRIEEDIITLQKSKETIGNAKNSRIVLRNKKKKSQNAIENLNTGTIKKKRLRKNNLNEVLEKSLTKEL